MKKNKKAMLLGFGAMTALITTGSVVISCGSSNADKQKLDGITSEMLKDAITKAMHPSDTVDPYPVPTGGAVEGVSINGLTGVTITFNTWTTNWTNGSLSFSVKSISKGSATDSGDKFGTITISGFKVTNTITVSNVSSTEGNLWSWDDTTKSLTIFEGVTVLEDAPDKTPYLWGSHDINQVTKINFPSTLLKIGENAFVNMDNTTNLTSLVIPASITSIGDNAFSQVIHNFKSLQFLGFIPPNSGRKLSVGLDAFYGISVTTLVDGDHGTAAQWQAWGRSLPPGTFGDT